MGNAEWLHNGSNRTIRSSVVAHLMDNNHRVNVGYAFCPIFQVRVRQSRCIRYPIFGSCRGCRKSIIQPTYMHTKNTHPAIASILAHPPPKSQIKF